MLLLLLLFVWPVSQQTKADLKAACVLLGLGKCTNMRCDISFVFQSGGWCCACCWKLLITKTNKIVTKQ